MIILIMKISRSQGRQGNKNKDFIIKASEGYKRMAENKLKMHKQNDSQPISSLEC